MPVITGTAGADVLNGTSSADVIIGLGGNDTLRGAGGNDTLIGGAGVDSLVGGGGDDTYVIDASDVLLESTGIDTVRANFTYALLGGFENLVLTGTSSFDGTGNSVANLITGNTAANTLGGRGDNDTLSGGGGSDSLLGGAGNDSLAGGAGADTLEGGTGDDTYVVNSALDVVTEFANQGTDLVQASVTYKLKANQENLTLSGTNAINGTGTGLANTITGNAAANVLNGGVGADTLNGGLGNDTYVVDNVLDVVTESANAGTDLIQSSVTIAVLAANVENLALTGANAIDGTGNSVANTVTGNTGSNLLSGGGGSDTLIGNGGADTLDGGAGNDSLDGGAGDDTLIYDAADGSVQGGAGTDTLRIDGGGITVDLTAIGDSVIADVEIIDLTGTGNNTLTLAQSDLLALSSTTDTLRVDGNAGDVVTTVDAGWLHTLDVEIGAQTYAQYTNGKATLQVDIDIDRSGIDTAVSAIQLSALSGTNGFRLDGIDVGDKSGRSVAAAGDVNGDGFDDLIIGAMYADPGGHSGAGESYVVFGKASGFASSIDLAALTGADGFRLDGIDAGDYSGHSVASAGDVNGDGFDDLIIGAFGADPGGDYRAGESYVVFGKASGFAPSIDLAALDGANGFRLDGIDAFDASGISVASAGDVNGDGFDDIIIGAGGADPGGDTFAGESYVVFGKASGFASSIDLAALNGADGFRVDGIDANDLSGGRSVASAGDVNGDGFDDLIIGAYRADPGGDTSAGESYVVFGKASGFASSVDLAALNGTNGFVLNGIDAYDYSGVSVAAAGDVNGDGFDDLIIGAWTADPDGDLFAGESYVVFGKASGFAPSIDLATLDGTDGFRLDGIDANDNSGYSVASAGDVNGDGFDDLIIGAYRAAPGGDLQGGESYVVFGKASGFASSIDLAALDGSNGFRLDGIDASDNSGVSVAAAGDVNGDGFDDLVIGAHGAGGGGTIAGESYVVFGGDFTGAVTHLGTSGANSLTGTAAAETFVSGQGNDTIAGGGGADVFNAGAGNDLIQVSSTTFANLDGGSGTDTLALLGGGRTLDLIALANNKITGIETINLTGGGDNTLTLAKGDLLDLSDTTNQLTVDGDTGDTVNLEGTWSTDAIVGNYQTHTQGAAIILVDTDIGVVFI